LDGWVQQEIGDRAWSVWDGQGMLDGWVQQQISDRAWSVGDGQGTLDCWVQQQIGDSVCSVRDGQCSLDGWVQQQVVDSAWSVGDGKRSLLCVVACRGKGIMREHRLIRGELIHCGRCLYIGDLAINQIRKNVVELRVLCWVFILEEVNS